MWPTISDMSRDECRKCLRCLELDAYGNMVSVLRAQGPFTDEKQKLLGELAKVLHISNERHRAEIRRAVNDEKLSVIAEQLNGPNTCTDWAIEGRRTIPLLPRLKAHTAFTGLANSLSLVIATANEKRLTSSSRVEEPIVKAEMTSREDTEQDERSTPKVPILHTEITTRGKKRKRSSPGSSDNDKCRKAQSTETISQNPEANSPTHIEPRIVSPLPLEQNKLTNVQVSIVTPTTTADTTSHNDNTLESSSTQLTCSSMSISNHHKFTIEPSITRNSDDTNSSPSTDPTPTNQQGISNDIIEHTIGTKSRVTAVRTESKIQESIVAQCTDGESLQFEVKESHSDENVAKETTRTDDGTKISRPDSTTCTKKLMTTKFCVTTKPVITSSTNCVVTVNSGNTTSCGPGPPCVTPSTTLTYKKLPTGKLNHHSGTKMGIALNCSKTLKINSHPNARLATKANVIVVQKGSSRGVTLSHGGKEVLGKVIMGGKNLCLATQKSNTSVALLPHRERASNNGDQASARLNADHRESLELAGKAGNMIMLDIRQDVLDKNIALSQLLEASGALNSDTNTAAGLKNVNSRSPITNNHVYDSAKSIVSKSSKSLAVTNNSLTLELSEKREMENDNCCFYENEVVADSSEVTDNRELLEHANEEKIETHDMLDAQTAIYNYETADETIIEDQMEESIQTSCIDIFSATLGSSDINLENIHYVNDEKHEIVIESREQTIDSPFSIVEQLDELSDS